MRFFKRVLYAGVSATYRFGTVALLGYLIAMLALPVLPKWSTLSISPAHADVNPIRFVTDQVIRPEVLIIVDNSGSMMQDPGNADESVNAIRVGNDCQGPNPVDICGDGFCTGHELKASCPQDCVAEVDTNGTAALIPGSSSKCKTATDEPSRMALVKRALRNVLPDLRTSASFAFEAYNHSGYYPYYKAVTTPMVVVDQASTSNVYFTQATLSANNGWDAVNNRPKVDFTHSGDGKTYRLISAPYLNSSSNYAPTFTHLDSRWYRNATANKTFNMIALAGTSGAIPTFNDGTYTWTYNGSFYREVQETVSSKRVTFLLSKEEMKFSGVWTGGLAWDTVNNKPANEFTRHGTTYKLLSHADVQATAGISTDADSLYRREEASGFVYTREKFSVGGHIYNDGTHTWDYVGSYYSYVRSPYLNHEYKPTVAMTCVANGDCISGTCTNGYCQCATGSTATDCNSDQACSADTDCTQIAGETCQSGVCKSPSSLWGCRRWDYFVKGANTCSTPSNTNFRYHIRNVNADSTMDFPEFKGPQFVDGNGDTWVYRRFDGKGDDMKNYTKLVDGLGNITGVDSSQFLLDHPDPGDGKIYLPFTDSIDQDDHDYQVGTIMRWMNEAESGGVYSRWCSWCTPNSQAMNVAKLEFIARHDGTGNYTSVGPDPAGGCRPRFILLMTDGQPTTTGGLPAAHIITQEIYNLYPSNPIKTFAIGMPGLPSSTQLDEVADAGDDGVLNGSKTAIFANNEKELTDAIREVLFDAIQGQYTTTSAGVASSGQATLLGDIGLIPSTEYPGWNGHLRAVDLKKDPSDPAYEMWDAGETLKAASLAWTERQIFTGTHTFDSGNPIPLVLSGGAVNIAGIRSIWTTAISDAELTAFIEWLVGKNRAWRLPPLLRSVPATVGPPPRLEGVPDHRVHENLYGNRQRLVYVASNEGLIHAFDANTGKEMFAFAPPYLLAKAHALYEEGGQSDDPTELVEIMTSSARVNDLKDPSVGWRTYLLQPYGSGGNGFTFLDITEPTKCVYPGNVATCSLNATPLKVAFDANVSDPNVLPKFGDTWSLPVIGWKSLSEPIIAMGSGYNKSSDDAKWYNYFDDVGDAWVTNATHFKSSEHPVSATPKVSPYAVLANTIAVEDEESRNVIATYQADLLGRIYRYEQGNATVGVKLLDLGAGQPIHIAPAALRSAATGESTLAINTGMYQETDMRIAPAGVTFQDTGESFASKVMVIRETSGTLNPSSFSCHAWDICNPGCFPGGTVVSPCAAPSPRALPVNQPLVVRNEAASNRVEAFFLYYDPPASICTSSSIAIGDSWVIRVAFDDSGVPSLVQSKKYTETQASGLVIIGGGQDVSLSVSGHGTEKASMQSVSGNATLQGGTNNNVGVIYESWKEVF